MNGEINIDVFNLSEFSVKERFGGEKPGDSAWDQISFNGWTIGEMNEIDACGPSNVSFNVKKNSFEFDLKYASCKMKTEEIVLFDEKFIQFSSKFSLKTAKYDFGTVRNDLNLKFYETSSLLDKKIFFIIYENDALDISFQRKIVLKS